MEIIKLNYLINAFLPLICSCCLAKSDTGLAICKACEDELPLLDNMCRLCSKPLPKGIEICGNCINQPPVCNIKALFSYQQPISNFIMGLKFHHQLVYAKLLGTLMAKHFSKFARPGLLIPVPLHRKRLRARGFNQALEIARPISKMLNLKIDIHACKRIRHTKPQARVLAKNRRANVKGVFVATKTLRSKSIVIIDDVVTTGQTANELAKCLYRAGAEKVSVWCCARTSES